MNPNEPGASRNEHKIPSFVIVLLVIFIITFVLNILMNTLLSRNQQEVAYSQFIRLVESGLVDEVTLSDEQVRFTLGSDADTAAVNAILYPDGKGSIQSAFGTVSTFTAGRVEDPELARWLGEQGVTFSQQVVKSYPLLSFIGYWIMPILIMFLLYHFLFKRVFARMGGGEGGGGVFGVGKSKAKVYNVEKNTGVTFADVAGQDEAKESLSEMVDILHNPERYKAIGAKSPKGALLVGPPGTGKTLLAKAVAGEAKVPFYSLSGSEFVEMFVGVGASRVRDLFEQANKNAPCIIFIDELDAIGKSRDNQMGSNDEREQTLNQLLAEMDGFDSSKGIIVLAATNRPEVLDKALLRPGRFDRRIAVEKPDLPGREAILAVHAKRIALAPDVELRPIALSTSGASGADLANIVNEAALLAVKGGRHAVIQDDLREAVELVIAGKEKKDRVLSPREREMVSYHEIGHALVSALQTHSQPVQKITIVPRTSGALGYTMNMPEEEKYLMTRSELLAEITTLLGGRAAELVKYGETTTGASNDIERATKLARSLVTQYGMSEKFGPMGLESAGNTYLDGRPVAACSEGTGAQVDEEVRGILEGCQKAAVELIGRHRPALEALSARLIEKENITGDEFMQLLEQTESKEG